MIAAHCDGCSPVCSTTIRTARSRTSEENRLRFGMTPFSHDMEPPGIPGRFNAPHDDQITEQSSMLPEA